MRFVLKSGNSLNPVFNATYRMGAAQTSSELSEVGIWHPPMIAKAQAKIIGPTVRGGCYWQDQLTKLETIKLICCKTKTDIVSLVFW